MMDKREFLAVNFRAFITLQLLRLRGEGFLIKRQRLQEFFADLDIIRGLAELADKILNTTSNKI